MMYAMYGEAMDDITATIKKYMSSEYLTKENISQFYLWLNLFPTYNESAADDFESI